MRTADLKVGEIYAIGDESDRSILARAIVHETKVKRTYRNDSYYPAVAYDGVRVTILGRGGKILDEPVQAIITPRRIVRTWAEHAPIQDERLRAREARTDARLDRQERMNRVARIIEDVTGEPLSRRVPYEATSIRLSLDEIETLIVNLRPREEG